MILLYFSIAKLDMFLEAADAILDIIPLYYQEIKVLLNLNEISKKWCIAYIKYRCANIDIDMISNIFYIMMGLIPEF